MSDERRPFLTRPAVIDWLQWNKFNIPLGSPDYPQLTLELIAEYKSALESANAEFEKYKVDMAALYRDETGKCYNTISELKSENAKLTEANEALASMITQAGLRDDEYRKENAKLTADFKELKIYYDDLYVQAKGDELSKLQHELAYYKEMESRYEQLLEETSNEAWVNMQNRIVELTAQLKVSDEAIESLSNDRTEAYEALNRIGMLAMSEHAYTSEFTEKARNIVQGVLK